jgi:S-formylglutathione hydrolase FrmB
VTFRSSALGFVCAILACTPAAASAAPLHLVSRQALDPRLVQLTFTTPAVSGPTNVRVLLPAGYAAHPHRRYPVLYLLHGAVDNYASWTNKGAAEQITAHYPLIVVMPDTGPTGGYTNWYNGGAGGPPEWETYHIDELLPWIDAHLRTRPSRSERAVAGLSMGGFGAMSYAARHPDLFAAAASFSGAVDTNNPLDIAVSGGPAFGPRATQEVQWRAHNPTDLAQNLRGLSLTVRTGNGMTGGPFGGGDVIEFAVHQMSLSFHSRLLALHIPHVFDDYGPGGHDWPYWQRDLRETLPSMMATFAHPRTPPSSFSFTAVEPRYAVYGWRVSTRRAALEFSTLRIAGPRSVAVSGSGAATVTSGPLYPARHWAEVRIDDASGKHLRRLRVGRDGRLSLSLDLGRSNREQEFTAQSRATGTRVVTGSARILSLGL